MDDSLREAIAERLRSRGYTPRDASSPEEGLRSRGNAAPYVGPPEERFKNIETGQEFTVPNPADRERIKKMKNVTIASGRKRRKSRGRTRGRSRSALKRRKVI